MKAILLTVASLIFSENVCASNASINILGFQDMSCGAWARSSNNEFHRAEYISWMRGIVTGYNHENANQITIEAFPGRDSLALYVDKFCRDNPLSNMPMATFQLIKDLSGTPRSKYNQNQGAGSDLPSNGNNRLSPKELAARTKGKEPPTITEEEARRRGYITK